MSQIAPPPIIPPEPRLDFNPSFLRALQGIWLFTWKAQFAWRRVPVMALTLLILPALIYLTTVSPAFWYRMNPLVYNPLTPLDDLKRKLEGVNETISQEQISKLLAIYREEYDLAEKNRDDGQVTGNPFDRRNEEISQLSNRIKERAKALLSPAEYRVFETYQNRKLNNWTSTRHGPPIGRTMPFYLWMVYFYFLAILPMACIWRCGALIRDELQADTLSFLTTRPLSRGRLLVIKYISQVACLQITMVIQVLLIFLAGWLRSVPGVGGLLPLFLGTSVLAVFAWSALGVFLGQVSQRYMAVALVYGLVVEFGIGKIPTNINALSIMRHLKSLLSHDAIMQARFDWPARGVPFSITALLVASVLFLTIASLMFTFKEYHHTSEMQK